MIYKRRKMTVPQYRERKEIYELLGYKEEKYEEKKCYAYVTYSLDENSRYYFALRQLEKKVYRKGPPFFPIFIFIGATFVLLSIFVIYLVWAKRTGTSFDLISNLFGFMLPAIACLLACVIYTFFYFNINKKIIEKGKPSKEELKKMVEEICKK